MSTDTTAMQDLLSICEKNISHKNDASNDKYSKGCIKAFQYIKEKIQTKLLPKEKEQIEQAHMSGQSNSHSDVFDASYSEASVYYIKTYNQ